MDIVERLRNNKGGESYTWQTISEAADTIERLRCSYKDCINAVDTIVNDGMTEPAKFAKIQYSGFTAYDYMIAMAEDIKDEIKKRAALKEGE
jgi:hypothetical protein